MKYPHPDPLRSPGEALLATTFLQAKQLAELAEANKLLVEQLARARATGAAGGNGRGPSEPRDPAKRRLRRLTLAAYARTEYLPGKNHPATSATAEICEDTLKKLLACFGREITLREVSDGSIGRFRNWLCGEIAAKRLTAATANKFLRQLRAIVNYAVGKKLLRRTSRIDFFDEPEPEVDAWTCSDLAAIETQARGQTGVIGTAPAALFWTAWTLVFRSLGSRVTATMLCRRDDFTPAENGEPASLLLRGESQKQRKDQRIALPPRAAAAVEKLLAAHGEPLIFGCWPHDPPLPSGRRKWKCLAKHFVERLVEPAGLHLPKGVKTRQFRRTAATIVAENGGDATALLGHSSRKTTERYKDRKRRPVCKESLKIPEEKKVPASDPQRLMF